jgi:antitoxin (DNA-binding transcriptional repressor) of toxin-antitoxin stability system
MQRQQIMKTITVTEFRGKMFRLLDDVLKTGIPIEITKGKQRLRITPVKTGNKLDNLVPRPEVIRGNPDDLADISWERELNFDLP